eukprot:Opistho-1_new@86498
MARARPRCGWKPWVRPRLCCTTRWSPVSAARSRRSARAWSTWRRRRWPAISSPPSTQRCGSDMRWPRRSRLRRPSPWAGASSIGTSAGWAASSPARYRPSLAWPDTCLLQCGLVPGSGGLDLGRAKNNVLAHFWRQGWKQESVTASLRVLLALATVLAVCGALGRASAALPALLGVIASALAETDDSWRGRLRVQLVTLASFALMAAAVQWSLSHPPLPGLVLAVAAIVLTLLGALGERYRAMASATLVMAVYAALASPSGGAREALTLLLAGAAWHGLISVLWAAALPMLPVRQNLADVYAALGEYLQLKSGLLEPVRDADLQGRRLALALQNGRVVEALNRCKESLFNRVGDASAPPAWVRRSLHSYLLAQEVHERSSSSHEDYAVLAGQFFHSDALYRCQRLLALLGEDCVDLAGCIRRRERWRRRAATAHALEDLQAALAHVEQAPQGASRRALAALRALATNLQALDAALTRALQRPATAGLDARLLDRQPRNLGAAWQRLREQLNLRSPLLRHGLRLAAALLLGYGLMLGTQASHPCTLR